MKTIARGPALLGIALLLKVSPTAAAEPDAGESGTQGPSTREAERLRTSSVEAIIAEAREAIRTLGDYRARLIKTERVKGTVLPAQTLEILVCHAPRAVRLDFVAGPKSGRRVAWRENHRPGEILVREGGLLGLASLWLDASGGLARGDTNHAVSEIGFAHALDGVERALRNGTTSGGYTRNDIGLEGNRLYRIEWSAPSEARGVYARRFRIGIDVNLHLATEIEVFDDQGFLERYEYQNLRPHQECKPAIFENL